MMHTLSAIMRKTSNCNVKLKLVIANNKGYLSFAIYMTAIIPDIKQNGPARCDRESNYR